MGFLSGAGLTRKANVWMIMESPWKIQANNLAFECKAKNVSDFPVPTLSFSRL